ncbi:hypothetical protein F7725_011135 [Dissostichus mawsoni]|uniref:Short chain dehydrogenase/reductase family 39U, member 1 n=1 Tax=Dissostichus mawsoni TaxID=36200 RepID=A0A7J5Z7Z6_DISMA|nr:hypothetical protein F7725_011135 [Dissostichus mawsoni]
MSRGGSGFVGRELTRLLKNKGHEVTVISRQPGPGKITWGELESHGLPPCEGAVNLAGENLMNPLRWWNESYKKDLFSSRIDTTKSLAQAIAASPNPPHSWVLVSGVACYKPSLTAEYTEESEWTPFDILSKLLKEWEASALLPENVTNTTKQVVIRSGAVLGRDGGAMKQMLLPFWLGLGGTLGSGRQPFPWIHVSDLAGLIAHALEPPADTPSPSQQVFNGVAPALNTNLEFTKELGRVLRRPTIFPVPAFVMNTLMGSERAVVLMEGQKVIPKRTQEAGFQYKYPDLTSALKEIVGRQHIRQCTCLVLRFTGEISLPQSTPSDSVPPSSVELVFLHRVNTVSSRSFTFRSSDRVKAATTKSNCTWRRNNNCQGSLSLKDVQSRSARTFIGPELSTHTISFKESPQYECDALRGKERETERGFI